MEGIYFEIIIFGIVLVLLLNYTGTIKGNKFIEDNKDYFKKLKEKDYDFYVKMVYGEGVDSDYLFTKRIRNGALVAFIMFIMFLNSLSIAKIVIAIIAGVFIFKQGYSNVKSVYKRHLHKIDELLPYYLKGLEILIQHYTVPVALGKSIDDAPPVFREGLQELISAINAGDSTVEPYMEFARNYPVRDSMRMMRLLYRLSLGRQERKQEQLITFSKTISNLQQKARETRYKERLEKMEGMTMKMLICTGVGTMILLVFAVLNMMG